MSDVPSYEQIRNLLGRYTECMDLGDFEGLASLFTDATMTESDLVATWSMTQTSSFGTAEVTMVVKADYTLVRTVKSPLPTPDGGTVMAVATVRGVLAANYNCTRHWIVVSR